MKSLEEFKLEEWYYLGQWEQFLFSAYFWVHWNESDFFQTLGWPELLDNMVIAQGHSSVPHANLERITVEWRRRMEAQDHDFLATFDQATQAAMEQSKKEVQTLADAPANADTLARLVRAMGRVMTPWYTCAIWSGAVEEMVMEELRKEGVTWNDLIAAVPQRETLVMKQHASALAIRDRLKTEGSSPHVEAMIDQHVDTYAWCLTRDFIGEAFTKEKFLTDLSSLPEKAYPTVREQNVYSAKLLFLAALVETVSYWRQFAAETFAQLSHHAKPYLHRVADTLGVSYREMMHVTPDEIRDVLHGKRSDLRQLIEDRRQNGFCIFQDAGQDVIVHDQTIVQGFIERITPRIDARTTEFKGVVAHPGLARGRVKVIFTPDQFAKMESGDVLVTTMTTPDFVTLMQKSVAIITDIGGLLSHAAIVSRELGRPCIIGTKIATKVLKDGDEVEVDATKGVVKILKRARYESIGD